MPSQSENIVQYFVRHWKQLTKEERAEVRKQEMDKLKMAKWKKNPTNGKWMKVKR